MKPLLLSLLALSFVGCGSDRRPTGPTDAAIDTAIDAGGAFFASGVDFSISATWTVNGNTADATVCTGAGIDRVRVVLWDAGTAVDVADLTARCSDGSFQTGLIFAWGNYETQWQALDADGNILGIMTDRFTLNVQSPTTMATLAPIDFVGATAPVPSSFSMALGWQTPDMAIAIADCATAGVTTMEYTLSLPDGTRESMMDIGCGEALENVDAAIGNYALLVTGADAGGNKYWTNTCAFTVLAGANTAECNSPYRGPETP